MVMKFAWLPRECQERTNKSQPMALFNVVKVLNITLYRLRFFVTGRTYAAFANRFGPIAL